MIRRILRPIRGWHFRILGAGVLCLSAVRVSLMLHASPPPIGAKDDPYSRLYGEWEIVKMIYKGKVQDFGGGPGGFIRIDVGSFTTVRSRQARGYTSSLKMRPGGFDLHDDGGVTQALYSFQDESLLIVWRDDGERPTSFEALNDDRATLYVLKKVVK